MLVTRVSYSLIRTFSNITLYVFRPGIVHYDGCFIDTTNGSMNKGTGIFTVADAGIYQVEKYFNTGLFGHKIGYLVIS